MSSDGIEMSAGAGVAERGRSNQSELCSGDAPENSSQTFHRTLVIWCGQESDFERSLHQAKLHTQGKC